MIFAFISFPYSPTYTDKLHTVSIVWDNNYQHVTEVLWVSLLFDVTHSLTESHLHFKQFAPDRCHKVEDTILGSRKLHIINEQGKQDEVRKHSGEIHNLRDTNREKQKRINVWVCCEGGVAAVEPLRPVFSDTSEEDFCFASKEISQYGPDKCFFFIKISSWLTTAKYIV